MKRKGRCGRAFSFSKKRAVIYGIIKVNVFAVAGRNLGRRHLRNPHMDYPVRILHIREVLGRIRIQESGVERTLLF